MNIDSIGLFSALKTKMGWLAHRQKLVAENVANASTPGYKPKDLKPMDFAAAMRGQGAGGLGAQSVAMRTTGANHMALPAQSQVGAQGVGKAVNSPDSEVTMDGNGVVLEEEMLKMAESRMQYEAAIGFYQKSLDMLRMASKAPGR